MIAVSVLDFEGADRTTVLIGCESMANTFCLALMASPWRYTTVSMMGDTRGQDERDRAERCVRRVMGSTN